MSAYHKIDINKWNRREHFNFFKDFDVPFFNITANVDVTKLLAHSRKSGYSFFLSTLFYATKAANSIDCFRYRILENDVLCYDRLHPSTTAISKDHIFKYTYLTFQDEMMAFIKQAELDLEEQINHPALLPNTGLDTIYFSSIPWVSFTSFQHARRFAKDDSIPRIVFGKYFEENGLTKMPMSVEVSHAMMDGYHVGLYFDAFQKLINS